MSCQVMADIEKFYDFYVFFQSLLNRRSYKFNSCNNSSPNYFDIQKILRKVKRHNVSDTYYFIKMGVAWKKCHKLKTSHVIKIRGVTKMRQNTIINFVEMDPFPTFSPFRKQ